MVTKTPKIFPGLVRVHVGAEWSTVHAPIGAKDEIKTGVPVIGRRWDPDTECWHVATPHIVTLCDRLREVGYVVRAIIPGRPVPPVQIPGVGEIRGAYGPAGDAGAR
jgi:hypothetical protein